MEAHDLGPNGSLVFCMEYLLDNSDWLVEKLDNLDCHYAIFDCPGQVRWIYSVYVRVISSITSPIQYDLYSLKVELFTHHKCVEMLIQRLQTIDCRLCSVQLVDSYYCW